MSLSWRTYRDPAQAPTPVLGVEPATYKLRVEQEFPDEELPVGEYVGAVGARTGVQRSGGDTIDASWLREEPVVLNDGDSRKLAEPDDYRPRSVYDEPRLVGPHTVLAPTESRVIKDQLIILDPTPLGDGVFVVEAGHVGQPVVRMEGTNRSILVDYVPEQGAFMAWDSSGTPVSAAASLKLIVREQRTMLHSMTGPEDNVIDSRTQDILATAERQPRQAKDIRRLPHMDPENKWDALDQAYYTGRPVPYDGYLWTVKTAGSLERTRDAIRRTLPASTVYQVEPIVESATQTQPITSTEFAEVTGAMASYGVKYTNNTYTGPVIRARRGTGSNTTFQDFTPTEIKDGTLGNWASQADGTAYVETLYDHSGNGLDLTQPGLEEQPVVAENGQVLTGDNSEPVIIQKQNGFLQADLGTNVEDYTVFIVGGTNNYDQKPALYELTTSENESARRSIRSTSLGRWEYNHDKFDPTDLTYSEADKDGIHAHLIEHVGADAELRFDGKITYGDDIGGPGTGSGLWLLNDETEQNYDTMIQEFILFPNGLSEYEKSALTTNADQKYSIGV